MKNNKNSTEADIVLTPDEPSKFGLNWFPGHMAKAIREIKENLRLVDIVLEIRDARAPLATGNDVLKETLRQKSHLIMLNKANLADPRGVQLWSEWFKKEGTPYMFVDCFDKGAMKKAMQLCRTIVDKKRIESNPELTTPKEKLKLMIIGLPNTGKSTIINQLANRTATKVADRPGQTQVQQWIVIDKNLDLLDTPGVLQPKFDSQEHTMWLSALHAIPDEVGGEEMPAHFLVNFFRERDSKEFKERYKLATLELTDEEIFQKIAVLRGCIRQKGLPDLDRVYKLILADFRKGDLGKVCFGIPPKSE